MALSFCSPVNTDMAQQINLEALKQALSLEDVLSHYHLLEPLTKTKDGYRGPCPFCQAKKAFTTKANLFKCFKCNASGSIVDFVMQIDSVTVRQAGLKLQSLLEPVPLKKQQSELPNNLKPEPKPKEDQQESPIRPLFEEVWEYLEAVDAPGEIYDAFGKIEDLVSTYIDHYHT